MSVRAHLQQLLMQQRRMNGLILANANPKHNQASRRQLNQNVAILGSTTSIHDWLHGKRKQLATPAQN